MPVEIFSLDDFRNALPCHKTTGAPLWSEVGLLQGEYCFLVKPFASPFAILVRSSVGSSGQSADTGEDSIRAYIVDSATLKNWGGKVSRWTTRLPGWQERMTEKVLRPLAIMLKNIVPCSHCGEMVKPFKVKKEGPNKGRLFVTCKNPVCTSPDWRYLDETTTTSTRAQPGQTSTPTKQGSISYSEAKRIQSQLYHADSEASAIGRACADPGQVPPQQSTVLCPECASVAVVRIAGKEAKNPGKAFYACPNRCQCWIGWAQ